MRRLSGFSLMEMMTVLLIVSVVAAASAPMINKRMMVNQAAGGCVWTTLVDGSIYYNQEADDRSVIIGANGKNNNNNLNPRLHIRTNNNNNPFITFQQGANNQLALNYRENTLGLSANPPANNATVIGADALASINSIAIGRNAQTPHQNAIVIGDQQTDNASMTGGNNAIAIGHFARALSSNALAMGNGAIVNVNAQNGIAIGNGAIVNFDNAQNGANSGIAIGNGARANLEDCIAIGRASFSSFNSIAIGNSASVPGRSDVERMRVVGENSVGIGNGVQTRDEKAVALGFGAQADNKRSIAIGDSAYAAYEDSVALGAGATTTTSNQIVLGTSSDTVYIPGRLVVGDDVLLNAKKGTVVLRTLESEGDDCDRREHVNGYFENPTGLTFFKSHDYNGGDDNLSEYMKLKDSDNDNRRWFSEEQVKFFDSYIDESTITNSKDTAKTGEVIVSDRRLKNVGKAFTSGLAEIKKLEVFNYTFKKDESKTPRVGVMAQDLQKIFPNAVTIGEDGFLRIRMEDMFYAVVNAVKELDNKFDLLAQKQKKIDELEAKLDKLEKRLEKLEKQK